MRPEQKEKKGGLDEKRKIIRRRQILREYEERKVRIRSEDRTRKTRERRRRRAKEKKEQREEGEEPECTVSN